MGEIQLSANRLQEGIAKNVASLFSKTVHQFHEKCFGTVAENETKAPGSCISLQPEET